MDARVAVLLAVLQGITEWLPVSSSAHLVIAQHAFGVENPVLFDTVVHLGTVTSVIVMTRRRLAAIASQTLAVLTRRRPLARSPEARLGLHVLFATVPIVIVGLALEGLIVGSFESLPVVAAALPLTGLVLLTTAHRGGRRRRTTPRSAVVIGLFQACALIPGISRSGMSISAGLHSGLTRRDAAEFSFLLAIPAILGAGALQFMRASSGDVTVEPLPLLLGYTVSAVVGYVFLRVLLRIVVRDGLHRFANYCFGLAAAVWLVLLL